MGIKTTSLMVRYLCTVPLLAVGAVLLIVGSLTLVVTRPGVYEWNSVAGKDKDEIADSVSPMRIIGPILLVIGAIMIIVAILFCFYLAKIGQSPVSGLGLRDPGNSSVPLGDATVYHTPGQPTVIHPQTEPAYVNEPPGSHTYSSGSYPPPRNQYTPSQEQYPPASGQYPPTQRHYTSSQGQYSPQGRYGPPHGQNLPPEGQYPPAQGGHSPSRSYPRGGYEPVGQHSPSRAQSSAPPPRAPYSYSASPPPSYYREGTYKERQPLQT